MHKKSKVFKKVIPLNSMQNFLAILEVVSVLLYVVNSRAQSSKREVYFLKNNMNFYFQTRIVLLSDVPKSSTIVCTFVNPM